MTVYVKGPIELRLGDYREVLADVRPDAVICDPPYSDRTHGGVRTATTFRNYDKRTDRIQNVIVYDRITEKWAADFVAFWAARDPWWWALFGDHVSNRWWENAQRAAGLQTFAPVPWVRTNAPPRFQGDGPQSACEWLAVARARRKVRSPGSRPGFYISAIESADQVVVGGKPLGLMRGVVRDYSEPGDLVCDPCAGGATTLIAAALEGRRAIGAELDPETFAKACARIERTALTPPLFHDAPRPMVQGDLL